MLKIVKSVGCLATGAQCRMDLPQKAPTVSQKAPRRQATASPMLAVAEAQPRLQNASGGEGGPMLAVAEAPSPAEPRLQNASSGGEAGGPLMAVAEAQPNTAVNAQVAAASPQVAAVNPSATSLATQGQTNGGGNAGSPVAVVAANPNNANNGAVSNSGANNGAVSNSGANNGSASGGNPGGNNGTNGGTGATSGVTSTGTNSDTPNGATTEVVKTDPSKIADAATRTKKVDGDYPLPKDDDAEGIKKLEDMIKRIKGVIAEVTNKISGAVNSEKQNLTEYKVVLEKRLTELEALLAKQGWPTWVIVAIVLTVLALAGAGAWYVMRRNAQKQKDDAEKQALLEEGAEEDEAALAAGENFYGAF